MQKFNRFLKKNESEKQLFQSKYQKELFLWSYVFPSDATSLGI